MKRVVAIVIIMAMVTSLFSFSVYADTAVQPLQVVTYSDTTTNVRISGTAERLHYNIESFQVVFMNPPNNYGTSCTPVLVSFRFYNASDTPAYVGQAEFELTATTGTGAVNTIIYGYDQISTDLFVAESSYSTAEVGRIGIGASNDFAYYTGFVIPPRTSLYFSCIVYVNASAYAQNNTGATEDVNQVTLSSLNLYTNQISFSEDYPYHNQPVDFSDIINAISDLADTVSSSSEMQDIIALITYTGSTYTENVDERSIYDSGDISSSISGVSSRIYRIVTNSAYIDNSVYYDSSNDIYYQNGTKERIEYLRIVITNTSDNNIRFARVISLNNIIPNGNCVYDIQYNSDLFDCYVNNGNNLVAGRRLYLMFTNNDGTYGYIPPNSTFTLNIIIHIYNNDNQTITFSDPSWNFFNPTVDNSGSYFPKNVYNILRDLYLSLNKKESEDNTEEAQDMNDEIHDQEQIWYDNNSEALEQVGLSNYRFSNSQSNGITQAVTQFQAVWNALGDWTNVYIFILILSISTYIIRHEPTTRVKQYRSSVQAERAERISYYGRKNAESRAANGNSTLKNAIRRRK